MKNKLAIWSWILAIIGFSLHIFFSIADELFSVPVYKDLTSVIGLSGLFLFGLVGFIFGIVGLQKVNKNPGLSGRTQAKVGIVLNITLFLLGLLGLGSGLFV